MLLKCVASAILLTTAMPAGAASNYLGQSGNITTPDDLTVPQGNFSLGYQRFVDLGWRGTTTDLDAYHGHFGLTPNIEVGVSVADLRGDSGSDVAINGKWRAINETPDRPSISIGVLDVAGEALDKDPTIYILVSKNLTPWATGVVAGQSCPVRGTIGIGTGFYDGVFAGLDWTLTPKLSVMVEYVRGGDVLGKNTLINGDLRHAVSPGFRLDGMIDFDEAACGVSYTQGF